MSQTFSTFLIIFHRVKSYETLRSQFRVIILEIVLIFGAASQLTQSLLLSVLMSTTVTTFLPCILLQVQRYSL